MHTRTKNHVSRNIKRFIIVTFQFQNKEDNGHWEAECLELGTATFAPTIEEAQSELLELSELHLKALKDAGELSNYLEEHNIPVHFEEELVITKIDVPVDPHTFVQSTRMNYEVA